MKNTDQNRNEAIDSIRGLAILSVILLHLSIFPGFSYQLPIPCLNNIIFGSGYYGVMVFFVISGFLITNSIIKKWGNLSSVNLFAFYCMRFARIMPCLIALLALLSFLDWMKIEPFLIHNTTLGEAVFSALTFQSNYLEYKVGYLQGSWDVLWSLSVEEVFYLFFPLLCYFCRNRRLLVIILFSFLIMGPLARSLITNEVWQDHSYLSCMDGIAMGVLAAICASSCTFSLKATRLFLMVGFIFFSFIFFFRHAVFILGLTTNGLYITFLELGIALILIGLSQRKNQPFKPKPWHIISYYGKNSYEIYLTHMLIIAALAELLAYYHFFISTWIFYTLALLLSGFLGALTAKQYSIPLNHWLRGRRIRSVSPQYREYSAEQ